MFSSNVIIKFLVFIIIVLLFIIAFPFIKKLSKKLKINVMYKRILKVAKESNETLNKEIVHKDEVPNKKEEPKKNVCKKTTTSYVNDYQNNDLLEMFSFQESNLKKEDTNEEDNTKKD